MDNIYLKGEKLYGDDFNINEIQEWYKDEEEGYFDLINTNSSFVYDYHNFNKIFGYKHIKNLKFNNVLGYGSSDGEELKPIIESINNVFIIEPSERFWNKESGFNFSKPNVDGSISQSDNFFDLITCFGVIHHVPNVSKVLSEFYRCLKPGGVALVREPIVSLGDWSKPRKGLTKRERGIPLKVFREIVKKAGFVIEKEQKCMALSVIYFIGYQSKIACYIDKLVSKILPPSSYHATNKFEKLGATSVFYVLRKPL